MREAWTSFWFAPVDPAGLNALRFLAGVLFLFWLLPQAGQQEAFFGMGGWFDRPAYLEASRLPQGPPMPIGWSILYLSGSSSTLVHVIYWGAIAVLALFTLGVWPRLTAVLTWVIVVSYLANPATRFEADYLLGILAFYLMIGYVLLGQWSQPQSLFGRLLGRGNPFSTDPSPTPSYAANLSLRLLQVHFAIVVMTSGLHKLQIGDWWSGVAFWYPLHPPFTTTAEQLRSEAVNASSTLFVLSLAAYLVLAWQIAFPVFAWRRRCQPILLGGAIVGWIGLVALYRLPLFGPILVLGCLSYLTPAEWRWILDTMRPVTHTATSWFRAVPAKNADLCWNGGDEPVAVPIRSVLRTKRS
jgi:hypothetical protein